MVSIFLMLHQQSSVIKDFRLQLQTIVQKRLVEVGDEDFLKIAVCGFSSVEFRVFLVVFGDFTDGFPQITRACVKADAAALIRDEQGDGFAEQAHGDGGGAKHLRTFWKRLNVHRKTFGR
jgi:hypothetical protein